MKKTLDVIKRVFTTIIAILAILMAVFTVVSVNTFDRKDRSIFGYKAFIVLSDSMAATDFSAGDLVISKEVPANTIKEGDIISFISSDNDSYGEVFTHKVRSVNKNGNDISFITYGTTTGVDDETPASEYNLLGKYIFSIPKLGKFYEFVKTTPGYICCILVPFMLLIVLQAIDTVKLFKQYKKEQLEEIEKEKDDLRKQKEENEKMMKELMELKAQMNKQEDNKKE